MIIMALDHTRDFFHYDAFLHDPLDVTTTSVALYFSRWITHFCAPVFVFLAGASIYLQSLRKSKRELSAFLFKRGAWLIFVEFFVISLSWTFDITYPIFAMQVIWTIGISMVLMSLIVHLPFNAILALGVVIVFGHNILDFIESTHDGFIWNLTRNGNFAFYNLGPGRQLVIIYPFVPWLGLMMLGYCLGKIYRPSFDAVQRKKILLWAGIGSIFLFAILRYSNIYGNPFHWTIQENPVFTFLSFLNVHKYPPSLLYICITIGPSLLFLSFFESSNNRLTRGISVYGRVPFFYYVLHFYSIHFLCMILFMTRGHALTEETLPVFGMPFRFVIAGEGYSLPIVYLIWIGLVLALYPMCQWFSEYKKRKSYGWLSYL